MAQIEYLAGVCNIGPEEIARRRYRHPVSCKPISNSAQGLLA